MWSWIVLIVATLILVAVLYPMIGPHAITRQHLRRAPSGRAAAAQARPLVRQRDWFPARLSPKRS